MSRAASLLQLQSTDSELDAHRARLRAIETALSDSPEVRNAQLAVVEAQAQSHAARVSVQSLEYDNQALSEKIAELEERMYGGQVTHPKELQDLQKDVESLKRRRQALEEQQLDGLIAAEAAEVRLQALEHELGQAAVEASKTQGHLQDERTTLQSHVRRLEIEREAVSASIPAADREMYDSLRQSKNGRAVARLEDGVCAACGVAPSSSRAQSVRQGNDLIRCGNCGRILCAD